MKLYINFARCIGTFAIAASALLACSPETDVVDPNGEKPKTEESKPESNLGKTKRDYLLSEILITEVGVEHSKNGHNAPEPIAPAQTDLRDYVDDLKNQTLFTIIMHDFTYKGELFYSPYIPLSDEYNGFIVSFTIIPEESTLKPDFILKFNTPLAQKPQGCYLDILNRSLCKIDKGKFTLLPSEEGRFGTLPGVGSISEIKVTVDPELLLSAQTSVISWNIQNEKNENIEKLFEEDGELQCYIFEIQSEEDINEGGLKGNRIITRYQGHNPYAN